MPTLWNQFAWNSGAVWEPASPPLSPNQKPKPQKQTHETTGLLPQQTLSDQPNWLIAYATRLIARDAEAGLSLAIINASVADAPYLAYAIGTWLPASKARKARKARKVRTARGVSAARRLCTAPGVRVVRPTDTMLPRLLRTLALLLLASAPAPAQNPQPLLYTVPFKAKADGYPRYRIPALWHAPQKPLLAFCEGRHTAGQLTGDIDIVLKRSHDLGQTWQPLQIVADLGADTCGNPCIVQDTSNGWLWLAFTKSRGEDHEADIVAGKVPGTTVWITHSEDDGATWAAPLEISASARKATWGWYGTGPGLGLYLHSTKSDRILFPSYHTEGGVYRTHSLFSDDHGKTWQLGADAADHTSEPQVIEWDTHTLLMNARTISGHGEHRTFVVSKDRGETWKPAERIAPLVENNCQGCTYRCFRSGSSGEFDWIFTTPIRPARTGVHAWISEDAGKSWPHAQLLWSGPSAYTAMTRLQGGLVGILIECGEKATFEQIAFTKFAPEWLKASKLPK